MARKWPILGLLRLPFFQASLPGSQSLSTLGDFLDPDYLDLGGLHLLLALLILLCCVWLLVSTRA